MHDIPLGAGVGQWIGYYKDISTYTKRFGVQTHSAVILRIPNGF
jgi:hypothetical protein